VPDTGILLAEDEAMKAKFSHLHVPDPKAEGGSRRAQVWFGMPSTERERVYPFVTIDLIDIAFSAERAHSLEVINVDWWPSEAETFQEYADANDIEVDPDHPYGATVRFQPYDIYYQVATHARYALQDRHLTAQMLSLDYAPLSQLGTLHVPADNTQRWLDNEGWANADYLDAEGKVVRRKVYTLKVSAHMAVTDPAVYIKVLRVAAIINGTTDGEQYAEWVQPEAEPSP
jgi:hypothetical protein